MPAQADITAKLRFYPTNQGGRKRPIAPPHLGCIFEIDGHSHDCRIYLQDEMVVNPGDTVVLAIQFLRPDLVLSKLSVGQQFFLWELGYIADGEVVEILSQG